jgi:hypothetical protein
MKIAIAVVFIAWSLVACHDIVPQQLAEARAAYQRAAKGKAPSLAPTEFERAREAMQEAEHQHRVASLSPEALNAAYIAHRTALLADVQGDIASAELKKLKSDRKRIAKNPPRYQLHADALKSRFQTVEIDAHDEDEPKTTARAKVSARSQSVVATIREDEDGGRSISFPASALFSRGRFDPSPGAVTAFDQIAEAMSSDERLMATISAGSGRASQVRDALAEHGIDESRILIFEDEAAPKRGGTIEIALKQGDEPETDLKSD